MPPLPGEERLLTTYADVHYYFAAPSPHPRQHRFDKASYLYVYHDAAQRRSRIEIANYPGTPNLDAFCGALDTVHLRNSDKFPTLCTLTADGYRQSAPNSPSGQGRDPNEWTLPYISPQDGSRSFLRLHTVDVYFWTIDDAKLFLATIQRLLAPGQLDIAQPAAREPSVNSVVQQLEHAAVSDPDYRHSQIKTPGSESGQQLAAPSTHHQSQPTAPVPLGQKLPTPEPVSPVDSPEQKPTSKPPETTQSYAPMAYNPAAPAAPEPVKPREKTPPPADAVSGTGLGATITSHGGYSSGPPPNQPTPPLAAGQAGQGYGAQPGGHAGYSSPPPNTGASQDTQGPQNTAQQNPGGSLSFSPPPTTAAAPPPTSSSGQAGTMPYSPPPQDPNAHLLGQQQQNWGEQPMQGQYNPAQPGHHGNQPGAPGAPGTPQPQLQQQQQPQTQAQPPPPMGGYADYSYGQQPQQPQQHAAQGNPYEVHNQVYRPTEGEHMANYQQNHPQGPQGPQGPPGPGGPGASNRPGKITENAMRVEKGVNRLFKKLEKKI